jgi:hypothetical protein
LVVWSGEFRKYVVMPQPAATSLDVRLMTS